MQNTDLRGSTLERLGFYLGHQWKNSSWIKRSFIIAVALIVLSVMVRIGGGDGSSVSPAPALTQLPQVTAQAPAQAPGQADIKIG